ncbi:MAG: HAD hydrolase family protein [Phycisphaerae bacterium]
MDLSEIRLLVLDVDGVLTPGDVSFDEDQNRLMRFDIHDGCALKLWHEAGYRSAILSGRRSTIVQRRALEMGISVIRQGVADKGEAFDMLLSECDTPAEATCFVGDDLPDLGPLDACGFAVAVANAVPAVKRVADYVALRGGGAGAVAEVIELILRKQGRWASVASKR